MRLISVTQQTNDDPQGELFRRMLALFDEYASQENAKHVLRAMQENARQGFWNGARPPYGYQTIEVEKRGDTVKKRLEINEPEATLVRRIFELYLNGEGNGPLGVKGIANYLNRKEYHNRQGKAFSKGFIANVLQQSAYIGKYFFNRFNSKTRKPKDRSEWIEVAVPAIIQDNTFERAQSELRRRSPAQTPPRVVNNPTLLTGLLKCAKCGGGMTLMTGKGGRYRYYTCAAKVRKGKTACEGLNIRADRLDALVLEHLERQVLSSDRLNEILKQLIVRSKHAAASRRQQRVSLDRRKREVESKLDRLYSLMSEGGIELDETLRGHIQDLRNQHEGLIRLGAEEDRRAQSPKRAITPRKIEQFADAIRDRLRDPKKQVRKAYLNLFIDRIELSEDEIRIQGPKSMLTQAIGSNGFLSKPLPSFDRQWWALQGSNL